MKIKIKLSTVLVLLILVIFPTHPVAADHSNAPELSGADVIAAINQYRQQSGIPPLQTNSLLTSLAQSQSEYQASISSVTHTGPGGSTAQQRAASAGYGGGSFFYMSEIIYGGTSATVSSAMAWWKNSSLHNSIMLDAKYTEIGAGVASNGQSTYFTAELGGPTGGGSALPTNSGTDPGSSTGESSQPPTQAAPLTIPVQMATPRADGTLIHIIQPGQSLWTISAVYNVELEILWELNDLNAYSILQPGDEILVAQQVPTPTPPASPTAEPTETPLEQESATSTAQPLLGTPFALFLETETTQPDIPTTPVPAAPKPEEGFLQSNPTVSTLVIAALVILVGVIVASLFIRPPRNRPPRDELLE